MNESQVEERIVNASESDEDFWKRTAKQAEEQRDAARRQAATYAAHIEDLSGQIDELRAERDRLKAGLTVAKEENYEARRKAGRLKNQRDLWRERALLARKAYHRMRDQRNVARAERETLNNRLQKLHGVFNTVWRFFDALYGASNGEPIPYLELPEEKQQLADEALDSVSEWLYGEPTGEWLHEETANE